MTISLIPCEIQPEWGLETDKECIADKDQQKAYLDPNESNFYITYLYYNDETFDSEQYGK